MSLDYGNARYTMAKCTHVLRTHKLAIHSRAWQQIKQIPYSKQLFNVSTIHSNYCLQFVAPVINGLVDDLLVKTLPAGAHSVFKIVQVGNWNAIHALLQSAPCRQHSRPDLSPGLWVAIQTVRWNSEWYAAGTRQLTSLDEMALRPVETRNDCQTSDECPEEDIAAAEFCGSNLHLPLFLDDLKDRVLCCGSRVYAF